MKRFLFSICFIAFVFSSGAQNTWIQRLNINEGIYQNTDSLTGIRQIKLCKDGSLFVLAYLDQNNREAVFKIPVTGSPILWSANAGQHFGMSGYHTSNIFATSDSGYIAGENYWDNSPQSIGHVKKISKNGTVDWEQQFAGVPFYYSKNVLDVIQNNTGNYYALIGDEVSDTLYEFDTSGNIIFQTGNIQGFRFFEMPNADLVVQTFDSLLERRNISGSLSWSVPSYQLLACTNNYSIILSPAGIQKIDNVTGAINWTKNYPFGISVAVTTPDGGFIAVSGAIPSGVTENPSMRWTLNSQLPGTLCKVDSMGDTLWTKHFDFPHRGLTSVLQLPSGEIITGGAFIFTSFDYHYFQRDYSSFVTKLDSTGHGSLETTSYIWPGNANDNSICGFVDDALYIAIAMNATGPDRDTLDPTSNAWRRGMLSDYAANWTDTFTNGVNYKHADFNGDGIIDTNDITLYNSGLFGFYQPIALQSWRLTNPFLNSSTTPDFKLIPERDTVAPGEMIRLYITIGNNVPVDSIYGLAFSMDYSNLLVDTFVSATFNNSNLGTPGNDLYSYYFNGNNFGGWRNLNVLACRTNQLDVLQLNDTIGQIILIASDTITSTQILQVIISDFNALTYFQTPVQLNLIGSAVVIDPTLLFTNEKQNSASNVFPNPTSNNLYVKNSIRGNKKISVLNSLGASVKEFETEETQMKISVIDLPDGIYTLCIQSEKSVGNTFFVVKH